MMAWFRALFQRPSPSPPPGPDVIAFITRQRIRRAHAIDQRRASVRVTRELRRQDGPTGNVVEDELFPWRGKP